jgi:hypothetical protein
MDQHAVISGYLDDLASRLPPEAVEELADGLHETYQSQVARGLPPDAAAAAAVAEFGQPNQVAAAFARHSPGHRMAVRLLATAPVFATLWAASLLTAQAWTWPVPLPARIGFALLMLTTAGTLFAVALSNQPRTTTLAAPAGLALILLDAAMLTAVALAAPGLTSPMALAIPASLIRIACTARALPRLLTGQASRAG